MFETEVIGAILLGILLIVFAVKILRLSDNLFGLLKPYSYTMIVCGIGYGTVVLMPFGIVMDVVNFIILGMIFFRAAEELPSIGE